MSEFRLVPTEDLRREYNGLFKEYVSLVKDNCPDLARDVKRGMKPLARELDKRGEKP